MDDIQSINKTLKRRKEAMEDLQRSVRNLKSENEKRQREINHLYFFNNRNGDFFYY